MATTLDLALRALDDAPVEVGEHLVQFYEHERNLSFTVSTFLGAGLVAGEAALVVATPAHRQAFDAALVAAGVDVPDLRAAGRYISCDAAQLLSTFQVDGEPDAERFVASVGGLVTGLTARSRPLRIYGEMVALLWKRGRVTAAIALESLWNDLTRRHPLMLLCAYPLGCVADTPGSCRAICQQHSQVIADAGLQADSPDEIVQLFEPTPFAVPVARRFVADAVKRWGRRASIEAAELVVSELASNAVHHGGRRFVVAASRRSDYVHIAVTDLSPQAPTTGTDEPEVATGGRGMYLIAAVSRRWGTQLHPSGKTVWADVG
jgi:MEDS: MEthanogen/methylotroph, DcmR Sensory domain/Histidine kinase-like ATPase domain